MTSQIMTPDQILESYLSQVETGFQIARDAKFINAQPGKQFGNGSVVKGHTPIADEDGEVIGYRADIELSIQDELMDRAAALQQSIINMIGTKGALDQGILAGLWKVYTQGLVTYLGEYNPEDFRQWAEATLTKHADEKYVGGLVFVIERVLNDVLARENSPEPYLTIATKTQITVSRLIGSKGSTSKLVDISLAYAAPGTTDEQRRELLDMIVTGKSREAVRKLKDEVNGKEIITLPYTKVRREDGLFDLSLTGLSWAQVKVFETLLKEVRDEQI